MMSSNKRKPKAGDEPTTAEGLPLQHPKRRAKECVSDPALFDHFLFQLLAFKVDHGNFHVPKEDLPDLHAWLQYLKQEYKLFSNTNTNNNPEEPINTSKVTAEQFKVLEFLHVPLTSRGDEHWNRFYTLLQQYKERHGHVLVPRLCEVPGLGDWVTDQRRQYKAYKQGQASQLSDERRHKLEELGFAWHVRNRPEWDIRYSQLLEYKEKHGDCKVPQHFKENKALGKWVAKQREQYKLLKKGQHSFLTPYRMEKLEQAGFVWQVRTSLDMEEPALEAAAAAAAVAAVPTQETVDAAVEAAAAAVAKQELTENV